MRILHGTIVVALLTAFPVASVGQTSAFGLRDASLAELEQLGLRAAGALVVEAVPDILARSFKAGDVLAFAGTTALIKLADLAAAVDAAQGNDIGFVLYRGGLPVTVSVRLTPAMIPAAVGAGAHSDPRTSQAAPTARTDLKITDDDVREMERAEAADRGDSPEVKALLTPGGNPNGKDSVLGRTALMWAIKKADLPAFQRLLVEGADVNAADTQGMTPLMYVCVTDGQQLNLAMFQSLLVKGADPKAVDKSERAVLYFAIESGRARAVQALLASGVDPNRPPVAGYPPPVTVASALGHVDIVRALLEQGARVDAPDAHGRTALMLAADNGEVEVVRLLAEKGANLNATNDRGQTALAIASEKRNEPPIAALMRKQQDRARAVEVLRQLGAR